MSNKFDNVPKDDDTKILFESVIKFDKNDVLYQKWYFDGIYAQSIIFESSDIAFMDDEDLKKYVASSDIVQNKSQFTISRKDRYTFVNFDFEVG